MNKVEISIIIPVYNEEENLQELFDRTTKAMDKLERAWELIFVNDGSKDNSENILKGFCEQRDNVRLINFNGNFGQHMAIISAFEQVNSDIIVTLDADLQNPPEEIHKLIKAIDDGYDSVGGFRKKREDTKFRKYASKAVNYMREKMTDITMLDQGCMLRAYKRNIIDAIISCNERSTFIPALAYKFSSKPIDVEVEHSERKAGESKYSIYKLIRLNFDLITGFTLTPLHLFTLCGFMTAGGSILLVLVLLYRRFISPGASEAEGIFTLFAILFFLVSVSMIGIGLIGEYVGRIYQVVQNRPKYIVKEKIGFNELKK